MSEKARGKSDDVVRTSMVENLQGLVDSFVERYRRGERPSVSEYLEKNPELAEKIREVFPALLLLGELRSGALSGRDAGPGTGSAAAPGLRDLPRLGEYRLIRELGRGGMGVVYEAEQESLGRRVALKVLPFHSLMDTRRIERFQREARAVASLQHPGIVPVFGIGTHEGIHYYAMQLVEGESLDRVLPEVRRLSGKQTAPIGNASSDLASGSSPLGTSIALRLLSDSFDMAVPTPGALTPPSQFAPGGTSSSPSFKKSARNYYQSVARMAGQVAEALAYAHGKGIWHRDIKPSNLILDTAGRTWVADFGLAKAAEAEELTRTGEVVGTLHYMAPEQFEGRVDHRSDIYSLGLTLYELLTLEPAFSARNRWQLEKGAPREFLPPRQVDSRIPPSLEKIVLKAAQGDPESRYQSALEMAEDLGRFLRAQPVRAKLPGLGYPFKLFIKRRWAAIAAVAMLIVVTGLALLVGLGAHHPLAPRSVIARDLDGDGDSDLVTANDGSNSVSVLLNNGTGGFTVAGHFGVGSRPFSVVAEDLDSDGDLDLVVSSLGSGSMTMLRNIEGGQFEKAGTIDIGAGTYYMASGDLDGDRDPDLAAAAGSNGVHVLRNQGSFRFEKALPMEIPGLAIHVAMADLDGDQDKDLVIASLEQVPVKNFSILKNRGNGSFEDPVSFDLGKPVLFMEAADLDGDGDLDLAATHYGHSGITVLWNEGNGLFGNVESIPVKSLLDATAARDFDGDGMVDLAAAGSENYAGVWRNLGSGRFEPGENLWAGTSPVWLEAVDLEGDRDLDLVVANVGSNDLTLFFNDGKGNWVEKRTVGLSSWWRPKFLSK